jgi:Zn-dependent peptidase ImmA (M78 family)/transcriptional regulator with XRE-family HTH domain
MLGINPSIMKWARETAGLTIDQAAKALGLSDTKGHTGIQRLEAIEAGAIAPTRPLLLKMAKRYRRSLLNFYLATPPKQGDRGQDFRSVHTGHDSGANSLIDALIRDLVSRQRLVRAVLEEEEAPALKFIGSANMASGATTVASGIMETLDVSIEQFRNKKNPDEAFSWLRQRAEAAGIFVMLAGNLGSHHTAIPVEAFRGFALADSIAPFVVINDQDARTAWSFTLIHEIAHLWLGATGVSGEVAENGIEEFCNEVAGEFLFPLQEAKTISNDVLPVVDKYAAAWNVSRRMIAYRFRKAGILTFELWRSVDQRLHSNWLEEKARRKLVPRTEGDGPNYYIVKRHRVGPALLAFADRAMADGSLSLTKAAKVLGVKPRAVSPLLADLPRGNQPTRAVH